MRRRISFAPKRRLKPLLAVAGLLCIVLGAVISITRVDTVTSGFIVGGLLIFFADRR